MGLGLVLRL